MSSTLGNSCDNADGDDDNNDGVGGDDGGGGNGSGGEGDTKSCTVSSSSFADPYPPH